MAICSLTLTPKPATAYVIVQTLRNLDLPFFIYLHPRQSLQRLQMNAKELDTLKLFLTWGKAAQRTFLETCNCRFLSFICECIANILHGNVLIDKRLLFRFQSELDHLRKKSQSGTVRRQILSTNKGIELINTIAPAIITKLG